MGAAQVIALGIAAIVVAAFLCALAVGIALRWTRRHPRPGRRGRSL